MEKFEVMNIHKTLQRAHMVDTNQSYKCACLDDVKIKVKIGNEKIKPSPGIMFGEDKIRMRQLTWNDHVTKR